jgi:hypothetical protein
MPIFWRLRSALSIPAPGFGYPAPTKKRQGPVIRHQANDNGQGAAARFEIPLRSMRSRMTDAVMMGKGGVGV